MDEIICFVFKPKGADRKQKTDREKMEKRTAHEKEKYQPSYDTTILTEVAHSSVWYPRRRAVCISALSKEELRCSGVGKVGW